VWAEVDEVVRASMAGLPLDHVPVSHAMDRLIELSAEFYRRHKRQRPPAGAA